MAAVAVYKEGELVGVCGSMGMEVTLANGNILKVKAPAGEGFPFGDISKRTYDQEMTEKSWQVSETGDKGPWDFKYGQGHIGEPVMGKIYPVTEKHGWKKIVDLVPVEIIGHRVAIVMGMLGMAVGTCATISSSSWETVCAGPILGGLLGVAIIEAVRNKQIHSVPKTLS